MVTALALAAAAIHWQIRARADAPEAVTIFEEAEEPAILGMGLSAAAGFASRERINPQERG